MARYHYCVVRQDLPVGQAMAQLAHAAGESFCPFASDPGLETYVVVLAARNEGELTEVLGRVQASGLDHVPIREPDLDGQLTAIGLVPVNAEEGRRRIRAVLGRAPLFKETASSDNKSAQGPALSHPAKTRGPLSHLVGPKCNKPPNAPTVAPKAAEGGRVAAGARPAGGLQPSVAQERAASSKEEEGRGVQVPPGGSSACSSTGRAPCPKGSEVVRFKSRQAHEGVRTKP